MYCDKAGFIARFGESELERHAWDSDAGAVDDARLLQALTDASNEIDLYISRVATLPIDTAAVPETLVRLCADIARFYLQDDAPLDEVKDRYNNAVRTLGHIASGKASLNLSEPSSTIAVHATRGEADRIFTRETLKDF